MPKGSDCRPLSPGGERRASPALVAVPPGAAVMLAGRCVETCPGQVIPALCWALSRSFLSLVSSLWVPAGPWSVPSHEESPIRQPETQKQHRPGQVPGPLPRPTLQRQW